MNIMRGVYFLSYFFLLSLVALFGVSSTFAAGDSSLYLSPAAGAFPMGTEFAVEVKIDTDEESINAAEGKITFNKEELEVVRLENEGSILSLWTTKPSFSNDEGLIRFGGGTSDGYMGTDGHILTVYFRPLQNTTSRVRFSTGAAILAADGRGTNILSSMNSGTYTFNAREVVPVIERLALAENETSAESRQTQSDKKIKSETHPDEEQWYAESDALFSWEVPDDSVAVRLLLDQSVESIPSIVYDPPISEKRVNDIENGTWYFHLQIADSIEWKKPLHFRVNIDMLPPSRFDIRESTDDGTFGFIFDAEDEHSGVSHYRVQIDDGEFVDWNNKGSGKFLPPLLGSGEHTLVAEAYDMAGNKMEARYNFTATDATPPEISDSPATLIAGEILTVRGKTAPDSMLFMWWKFGEEEAKKRKIVSDMEGMFVFTFEEKVNEGMYEIWTESVVGGVGTGSLSKKISIPVSNKNGGIISQIISLFRNNAKNIALAGMLFFGVALIFFYIRRRRAKKKSNSTQTVLVKNHPQTSESKKKGPFPLLRGGQQIESRTRGNTIHYPPNKSTNVHFENRLQVKLKKRST